MSRSLCHALLVPIPGMLKCQRTLLGRQSWLKRRCEALSSSGSSALPLAFPQECEGAGTGSPELQWAGALTSGRRKKPVLLAQGSVRGAWCLRGTLAVPLTPSHLPLRPPAPWHQTLAVRTQHTHPEAGRKQRSLWYIPRILDHKSPNSAWPLLTPTLPHGSWVIFSCSRDLKTREAS